MIMYISFFLCRVHVVLKYMLRHDKEERFFPVIAGAFWLNVVLQSALYLIYIQMPSYDKNSVSLNSETIKMAVVIVYFVLIGLFYFGIGKAGEYSKAENWFLEKTAEQKRVILVSTGFLMATTFLSLLFAAIYHM